MDTILLKNMKFYGYHGVLDEEQEKGQNFIIDAELAVDLTKACATDQVEHTVDYAKVFEVIRGIVEKKKFRLIEKLADSISREILSKFLEVKRIKLTVKKPEAPIQGSFEWMGVEITRFSEDE